MTLHTLVKEQHVPAPLERVFGFFAKPENLSILTPADLGFEILSPTPIAMRAGARIDYAIRLLGIRVRWTSIITDFEPGRAFVDEQLRGPYAFWRHRHEFREAEGGTIVRDEVRYALPLGPIGELAHWMAVRSKLGRIFSFRADAIARLFTNGGGAS